MAVRTIVKDHAELAEPYTLEFKLTGLTMFMFGRPDITSWDDGGSRHVFDPESKVWRNGDYLAFPGHFVLKAMYKAAKFVAAPTGLRGSAWTTEAFTVMPDFPPFTVKEWDAVDERIAGTKGAGGTRIERRPILHEGWETIVAVTCVVPEKVRPNHVINLLSRAGLAAGIGENTKWGSGRFAVTVIDGPDEATNGSGEKPVKVKS